MSAVQTQYEYRGEILRKDGVSLGRRPIPEFYLELGREQALFLAQRRGVLGPEGGEATVTLEPVFEDEVTQEVGGVIMTATGPGGASVAHSFGVDLFKPYLELVAADLAENKQVGADDELRFRIFATPVSGGATPADGVSVRLRREPLPLLDGQLEPYLRDAVPVGPVGEADYPLFVLDSALDEARRIIWERNKERGVWLVGRLFRQREPVPEIFGLIEAVFEVRGATHERFSLDMTTETFVHVDELLARRRNRLGKVGEVRLGVYHTHPFLPSILDGKENCPSCPLRPECKLTSSFFSKKDAQFHHAVFGASAAYAVELVLGLTPREEFDLKMFALDGGRFRERGYYRLAAAPDRQGEFPREHTQDARQAVAGHGP